MCIVHNIMAVRNKTELFSTVNSLLNLRETPCVNKNMTSHFTPFDSAIFKATFFCVIIFWYNVIISSQFCDGLNCNVNWYHLNQRETKKCKNYNEHQTVLSAKYQNNRPNWYFAKHCYTQRLPDSIVVSPNTCVFRVKIIRCRQIRIVHE